jgi:hypothetical protein
LLRAIYGTFSHVKELELAKHACLQLNWVAFVAAQGEFQRYKGDHFLTENDVRNHTKFNDAIVMNGGAFCLHYPGNTNYDFRLKDWKWDGRDGKDYDIPFRCLYSTNIDNIMMAREHISATHIALSNVKFIGNGVQHAIATAVAAHLCRKHNKIPRHIGKEHFAELQGIVKDISEVGLMGYKSHLEASVEQLEL